MYTVSDKFIIFDQLISFFSRNMAVANLFAHLRFLIPNKFLV